MEILALFGGWQKYAKLKSANFSNCKILKCLKLNCIILYGVYLYLSINSLKPVIRYVIDDHVNWPWSYKGIFIEWSEYKSGTWQTAAE